MEYTTLSWDEFHLNAAPKTTGKLKAFCSSIKCSKQNKKSTIFNLGTEINHKGDWCPHCGSALFFTRHEGVYKKGSFKGVSNVKKSRRWK